MADHQEASVILPSLPASVPEARAHVARILAGWGLPPDWELSDSVRLIVSELATNAVQHTDGRSPVFTLDLELVRDELLRIGVTDSHPGRPRRQTVDGECPDNGRGMDIVRLLTAEHGGELSVIPTAEGGKTVRTSLPLSPAPKPVAN